RAPGGADLPASLAGVSFGGFVPILEVTGFLPRNPLSSVNDPSLAAITIQFPLEPSTPSGVLTVRTKAGVWQVGTNVYPDQVHVLTSCDPFMTTAHPYTPASSTGLPCPSIVAHADGTLVSAKNPAKGGEELVAYAVGLGQTNPPLATGKLVTAPAPTA